MAAKRPPPSYLALALALGAIVAEIEVWPPGKPFTGLAAKGRRRLKNEADLSIVVGLHGERESPEEHRAHEDAIALLGKIAGVVERQNGKPKPKDGKRRRA